LNELDANNPEMNHPTTAPEISADLERRAVFIEAASPAELAATLSKEQATWTNLIFDYARRQEKSCKEWEACEISTQQRLAAVL
jgi:tRNA/tmRNA/rRNA uracil-C5-methylase (TrmA/RlmC/RlmD family)